jgi:hypothetical protein
MTRTVKSQANEQEEDIYSEALLPSALPSALPNPISLDKINVKVEEDASEKMTQLSRSPRLGEEGILYRCPDSIFFTSTFILTIDNREF